MTVNILRIYSRLLVFWLYERFDFPSAYDVELGGTYSLRTAWFAQVNQFVITFNKYTNLYVNSDRTFFFFLEHIRHIYAKRLQNARQCDD